MASIGLSGFLVVLSIVLFFVFCMKGLGPIPTAIICTIVVGLSVEGGPIAAIWGPFAQGMGGMAGGLAFPFITGGIFGGLMTVSGASEQVGRTLIKKFGIRFAPYALMVFVMILAYVNVLSFPFLGAVLAFSLMKAANLPRNVACVAMVGTASLSMYLLPGSTSTPNMLAGSFYKTNLYAGGWLGIIMAVIGFLLVALYVEHLCKMYRAKGIGYTPTDMEKTLTSGGDLKKDEELPSFFISMVPIIIVIGLALVCQLCFGLNAFAACVTAQIVGTILTILLNFNRISGKMKAIADGAITSCLPLIQTTVVVGYATVVTATPAYGAVIKAVTGWNMNPYVLCVVGTAIFALISADPIAGISLSGKILGDRCVALGGKPALLHRLTMAASTTFDSMPFSGNLNITMNFLGLTHKEVYKQIVVVQIAVTSFYTIVGMVISMIIG
jgi:H+/gluconate symporter-like permease